jgi:RNA polymerase sigma-70 factor (ECF subfamily)
MGSPGHSSQPGAQSLAALRAWAPSAIERGRAAWPGVEVSEDELIQTAARRLADPDARSIRIEALDAAEIYLVAGCVRGDPAALGELRARYFDVLGRLFHRMDLGPAHMDDLWQVLSGQLLIGSPGAPPRIVRYAGAGQIGVLVRVAATRQAVKLRHKDRRDEAEDRWFDALPAAVADPELSFMKREHRDAVKEVMAAAVQQLTPHQRMVLRLHLVQRLSVDGVAAICSVHRATAARHIVQARETLVTRVRLALVARWHVSERELPQLASLVASQLDLSLPRLLDA